MTALKKTVSKPKAARGRVKSLPSAAVEDAMRTGLLDRGETVHISFRAPKRLVDAAKREAGLESPTEIGIAALALLAQPDPVAAFLARTRGRLGSDHDLDY